MVEVRIGGHTATLLNDGRVLVAGGVTTPVRYVATAEVFNPSTGLFSSVGSMAAARAYHTATVLPDGKVLMAGGIETNASTGATFRLNAEIFDPVTNVFTSGPPLAFVYEHATATELSDHRVLIVGGASPTQAQARCQLYDPGSGTFSLTSSLAVARYGQTANRLPTGGVLIVGGDTGLGPLVVPAEIYEQ